MLLGSIDTSTCVDGRSPIKKPISSLAIMVLITSTTTMDTHQADKDDDDDDDDGASTIVLMILGHNNVGWADVTSR